MGKHQSSGSSHFHSSQTSASARVIGQTILRARNALGMSQRDLALAVGINRSSIGHWERGDYRPTRQCAAKLATVLRIDVSELDPTLVRRRLGDRTPQASGFRATANRVTAALASHPVDTGAARDRFGRFSRAGSAANEMQGVLPLATLPAASPSYSPAPAPSVTPVSPVALASLPMPTPTPAPAPERVIPAATPTGTIHDLIRATRMPGWGLVERVDLTDSVATLTNCIARLVLLEKMGGIETKKTLFVQTMHGQAPVLPKSIHELAKLADVSILTFQVAAPEVVQSPQTKASTKASTEAPASASAKAQHLRHPQQSRALAVAQDLTQPAVSNVSNASVINLRAPVSAPSGAASLSGSLTPEQRMRAILDARLHSHQPRQGVVDSEDRDRPRQR